MSLCFIDYHMVWIIALFNLLIVTLEPVLISDSKWIAEYCTILVFLLLLLPCSQFFFFFALAEYMVGGAQCDLSEELLFVFPVINFVSSPSASVKEAATDLLFMLEKVLVNFAIAPKEELSLQGGFPPISKPASMIFRLLQQLWFQVYLFLSNTEYYLVWSFKWFSRNLVVMVRIMWSLKCFFWKWWCICTRHGFQSNKVVCKVLSEGCWEVVIVDTFYILDDLF